MILGPNIILLPCVLSLVHLFRTQLRVAYLHPSPDASLIESSSPYVHASPAQRTRFAGTRLLGVLSSCIRRCIRHQFAAKILQLFVCFAEIGFPRVCEHWECSVESPRGCDARLRVCVYRGWQGANPDRALGPWPGTEHLLHRTTTPDDPSSPLTVCSQYHRKSSISTPSD